MELQRENTMLREALSIKSELENMRPESLGRPPASDLETMRNLRVIPEPRQEPNLDDWYNDADVSVSSTGSQIRRRLQDTLDIRSAHPEYYGKVETPGTAHITPPYTSPAPVLGERNPNRANGEGSGDRTFLQFSYLADIPNYRPNSSFAVNQTAFPTYANLMNETVDKLPPLFKPLATTSVSGGTSSSLFSNWQIPEPVLFGLGGRRN